MLIGILYVRSLITCKLWHQFSKCKMWWSISFDVRERSGWHASKRLNVASAARRVQRWKQMFWFPIRKYTLGMPATRIQNGENGDRSGRRAKSDGLNIKVRLVMIRMLKCLRAIQNSFMQRTHTLVMPRTNNFASSAAPRYRSLEILN